MSPLERFHPAVRTWFERTLGQPSEPQRLGWPAIQSGRHALIAAPTGTGKTLAAFLWSLDALFRQGSDLSDETQVVYVSPLRALAADVQKNLLGPLAAIRALDPSLPEIRVLVRTGDTPASQRAAMVKRPPHVLVTTPESLYLLLTSAGGRAMLRTAHTCIVDEIHALARDKRGSHLALSLERLAALAGEVQRIGLSATQKPLDAVGHLLGGVGRDVELVDAGHLRAMDLGVVVPDSPLAAVCSHEQWGELYRRMAALIRAHRTTLIFTGTRKLAERLTARLAEELGADGIKGGKEKITCHHGSLSRELRQQAERRLKAGELSALVATASLELGIDIGEVDLVIQVGSARSIATLLQRLGRSGHGVDRTPKGRLFPLTLDEAVEALALLRAIRRGELDRTPEPPGALDVLAQQIVAACVGGEWREDDLYDRLRRAWPYRGLARADFDALVEMHATGRSALLHRDGVNGRLLSTKRARIPALTAAGAIPDTADYRVLLEPEGTQVGTLNEDFAIESDAGDVFQLGNASWQILRIEPGIVRVADAEGAPPSLPFWIGEAPARTRELSAEISAVRELRSAAEIERETGAGPEVAGQVAEYLTTGRAQLGCVPTVARAVAERFFDESGGSQLVIHAPHGSRVNRALGLALRKRVCRSFGFELQAAANEEAVLLSLGPQHGFPLEEVFRWLRSTSARDLLVQALLASPMFMTRWRWNAERSLMLARVQGGKRVPPPIRRMRADDLLAQAFPSVMACGETLPPGDLPLSDHPIVRQTIEDCLREAMDVDGFVGLLRGIESGSIETAARDTSEPSVFAQGVMAVRPYGFLDDAPLEERRVQAVRARRTIASADADRLGELDPAAIERVRAEAWPDPESAEELHEALTWMGFVEERELGAEHCVGWRAWLGELAAAGRAVRRTSTSCDRWFAREAPDTGAAVLRGRLEVLGPVDAADPLLAEFSAELGELEAGGEVLRARFGGRPGVCNRRLLARIHRMTLQGLRREIRAVSAADFLRFLCAWQRVLPSRRAAGPMGTAEVIAQLAGFQASAPAWERHVLPARIEGFRPEWLDQLAFAGVLAWGRLFGAGAASPRAVPVALVPRAELEQWLALAEEGGAGELKPAARDVLALLALRGSSFRQDLLAPARLLPSQLDEALAELVGHGLATCDAWSSLRRLLGPYTSRSSPRRYNRRAARAGGRGRELDPLSPMNAGGRWSALRTTREAPAEPVEHGAASERVEFAARALLRRTGVVFRRTLERERLPIVWRELVRVYRRMEDRGEIRGGRFVAGFTGEQYALPEAVELLRAVRREPWTEEVVVSAADPLNYSGILTPGSRTGASARERVVVARPRDAAEIAAADG